LNALGLDVQKHDLKKLRQWFASQKVESYLTRCIELAGVKKICMTNSPFDPVERAVWQKNFPRDERFMAALRIDQLLLSWNETAPQLSKWGYQVSAELSQKTISEGRRFLSDWSQRMKARYVMISLPPEFNFPEKTICNQLLEKVVLPHCREFGLPLALMPGVRRAVNPALKLAGDGVGLSSMKALGNLCANFPENKFLATVLARENQHELCVIARKFRNLHIFGCWWFTNVPHLIEEITRLRLELLGLSATLQHSDARVCDQLIYKWQHSKKIIARVLAEKYHDLFETGWQPTLPEIERDVKNLFGGAFEKFCAR
ncbi:MAG: glucuronate isomerase, partial [Limisphaerales bacterium]